MFLIMSGEEYNACNVDECVRGLHSCRPGSEACFNVAGSYACGCQWGFLFDPEEGGCVLNTVLSVIETKVGEQEADFGTGKPGQNKNQMILMVLIYIIAKKHFDSVDLKFLVSEHSYMSCGREFGIIEKRKKKRCKTMVPEEFNCTMDKYWHKSGAEKHKERQKKLEDIIIDARLREKYYEDITKEISDERNI
ncbi:hypothetical protein ANN_00611 [Periplaneta americana]|uniref:EGF-like calcium-binding domain-containing protein n=1 Tax=Periplaneta americana TaxID=6978 RepID=A0ABQ8TR98_PERAM|nr:hypothetical protein ANN_00611 [Periplaneta americana]